MELKEVREQVDRIDDSIFELLKQRYYLVKSIMSIKKLEKLPLEDKERENAILERLGAKAEESELDASFVKDMFASIIENSKTKHIEETAPEKGKLQKTEDSEEPMMHIAAPEDMYDDSETGEKHDSDII
ncbi:MAG: chorismate mutase [Candidatus Woesearchaeota archaeon]